jgi:hypothetical protein
MAGSVFGKAGGQTPPPAPKPGSPEITRFGK